MTLIHSRLMDRTQVVSFIPAPPGWRVAYWEMDKPGKVYTYPMAGWLGTRGYWEDPATGAVIQERDDLPEHPDNNDLSFVAAVDAEGYLDDATQAANFWRVLGPGERFTRKEARTALAEHKEGMTRAREWRERQQTKKDQT